MDPWDNGFVDLVGEQDLLGQRGPHRRYGHRMAVGVAEPRSVKLSSRWRSTGPPHTPRRSALPI